MNLSRYRKIIAVFSALALFALAACGGWQAEPQTGQQAAIADREGNMMVPPEKADKIISMAPSVTETLIHLGLGDKLVAVDKHSAVLSGLPDGIPVYDLMAPDAESIASLAPDIIFASSVSKVNGDNPFQPIVDLGAAIAFIPSSEDLDGVKEDVLFIGKITGRDTEAEAIVAEMEEVINETVSKIKDEAKGQTVYFEVASAPDIYTFGKGVFLNEMFEMLGTSNIFSDLDSWASVSEEAVIERNPDVIFTNVGYIDDPVSEILERNGWDEVTAVKNGRVFRIDENSSSRPNEFAVKAFLQMAEALYPEAFK